MSAFSLGLKLNNYTFKATTKAYEFKGEDKKWQLPENQKGHPKTADGGTSRFGMEITIPDQNIMQ